MNDEGNGKATGRAANGSRGEEGEARQAPAEPAQARTPKRRGAAATMVGMLALAMNLAAGGMLLWRAERFAPDNYWTVDTRLFWFPAGVTCLWGLMELLWWRRRGRFLPVLVVLSAAALAGHVFVFDHYNILVHVERWVDRGMPMRWMH